MTTRSIVVGSSDNLIGRGLGQFIDEHEVVVRCNRAPIKGYEVDVGSKETRRFMAPTVATLSNKIEPEMIPLKDVTGRIYTRARVSRVFMEKNYAPNCSMRFYGENDWRKALRSLEVEPPKTLVHPSTGLEAVIASLFFVKPNVVGFDVEDRPLPHHYWRKATRKTSYHRWPEEKQLLRTLHDLGYINWMDL